MEDKVLKFKNPIDERPIYEILQERCIQADEGLRDEEMFIIGFSTDDELDSVNSVAAISISGHEEKIVSAAFTHALMRMLEGEKRLQSILLPAFATVLQHYIPEFIKSPQEMIDSIAQAGEGFEGIVKKEPKVH